MSHHMTGGARPLAVIGAIALAGCASSTAPLDELPRSLTPAEASVVSSSNEFGLDLFGRLAADTPDDNVFTSPLSAYIAIGMVANGADGSTLEGIRSALHQPGLTEEEANEAYRGLLDLFLHLDSSVELEIANSIWYRETMTLRSEFASLSDRVFDAAVRGLSFDDPASVDVINGWVAARTRDRIDEIVAELPPELVMLLINAIYFKGSWQTQFDPDLTRPAPFMLLDGSRVDVPMMTRPDVDSVRYADRDGMRAIELPYGRGAFAMTVILPPDGVTPAELAATLDGPAWMDLTDAFEDVSTFAMIGLPKFRLEWEAVLNPQLAAMGMSEAFTDHADLSRLFDEATGLTISEVKQKTFVDVNEEGTEAAAVTSVGVSITSAPPSFIVDRPFIFAIRERFSGTVLFIGQVLDPRG
ncbi:MAG: serpin family protein [Gemmatimonadota bacterium]|nr:serpin family protein [Gemmatimonadota bacterium]